MITGTFNYQGQIFKLKTIRTNKEQVAFQLFMAVLSKMLNISKHAIIQYFQSGKDNYHIKVEK